ncbi:hypothetical protein TNCV_4212401 [Trichonephila clavipes]|nr:hypothetical protein TNCV_4212401 [Trichonephila clavipes]
MAFGYPQSQKSQGFKSRDLGGLADNSVVTEMSAEHLFRTVGNVWRSTILHKQYGCITSPCLKSRNNGLL